MHHTIKQVTTFEEALKPNMAIGKIMEFVNNLYKYCNGKVQQRSLPEAMKTLALLIAPFAPHIAEETWEKLGNKNNDQP